MKSETDDNKINRDVGGSELVLLAVSTLVILKH